MADQETYQGGPGGAGVRCPEGGGKSDGLSGEDLDFGASSTTGGHGPGMETRGSFFARTFTIPARSFHTFRLHSKPTGE